MKYTQARKVAVAGLAGIMALTLAACNPDNDTNGVETNGVDPGSGPVELRMALWTGSERHLNVLNEIADNYVAANPDKVSDVTFVSLTDGDYITSLTTMVAGNEAPDLAWVFEANATEFIDQGVLVDVSDTLQSAEGYDFDDIFPGAIEGWSRGDAVYAYPFSSSPFGVFMNLDLLEAAGQPMPRDLIASGDWNWDKVAEISAAVGALESIDYGTVATSDIGPFRFNTDPYINWQDSLALMWPAWGASAWSEDGLQCEFTSPETVSFFEWYHDQTFNKEAFIGPGETFEFNTGQAAGYIAQMSSVGRLAEVPFEWDFLPMPEGPAGAAPLVGQAGVGVLSRSENQEVAADFLAYFTSPENAPLLAQFFPPPREAFLTLEILSESSPLLTDEQIQGTIIDQAREASVKAGHRKMNALVGQVRSGLDALWLPDADVQAGLEDVCTRIQPVLER